MHTAIGPWRMRSSGGHCDPELAERIGETLGEEDWRGGEGEGVLTKSKNPHLAGGEKRIYSTLSTPCLLVEYSQLVGNTRYMHLMTTSLDRTTKEPILVESVHVF